MKIELDKKLVLQAQTFKLRASCEYCAFYIGNRCAHEWPDRGQSTNIAALDPEALEGVQVEFCKEFELR